MLTSPLKTSYTNKCKVFFLNLQRLSNLFNHIYVVPCNIQILVTYNQYLGMNKEGKLSALIRYKLQYLLFYFSLYKVLKLKTTCYKQRDIHHLQAWLQNKRMETYWPAAQMRKEQTNQETSIYARHPKHTKM